MSVLLAVSPFQEFITTNLLERGQNPVDEVFIPDLTGLIAKDLSLKEVRALASTCLTLSESIKTDDSLWRMLAERAGFPILKNEESPHLQLLNKEAQVVNTITECLKKTKAEGLEELFASPAYQAATDEVAKARATRSFYHSKLDLKVLYLQEELVAASQRGDVERLAEIMSLEIELSPQHLYTALISLPSEKLKEGAQSLHKGIPKIAQYIKKNVYVNPLNALVRSNDAATLELLLKEGMGKLFDPNQYDGELRRRAEMFGILFHIAITQKASACLDLLLRPEYGILPTVEERMARSLLQLAEREKAVECAALLQERFPSLCITP